MDSEGRRGSVKVEGVRFLSLCGLRGPMRMKDLLVGKSAPSYLNQSLRLEPLAAQTRCTLSPFDLLVGNINGPIVQESQAQKFARRTRESIFFLLEKVGSRRK